MPKAYIHIPPMEIEAGRRECVPGCIGKSSFFLGECMVFDEKLPTGVGERGLTLRCPACHAAERPATEGDK